ncbi:MAG: CoA transferase [Acidobacteria bacterium]|nr:CoA transferase [Acidobacteriota bacterium]
MVRLLRRVSNDPISESHTDYATNADRVRNRKILEPMIAAIFREQPAAYWIEKTAFSGGFLAHSSEISRRSSRPQSAVRELFPTLVHPKAGPLKCWRSGQVLIDSKPNRRCPAQ